MKNTLLAGALALCITSTAFAGTCASPTPLASNSSVPSGSTCGGEVGINMGGTIYAHPSQVYSVHINHQGPDGDPLGKIVLTGTNREASLTTSCSVAPIQVAAPGVIDIDANTLANGDYLLVVSTDPSLPVTDPPTCGDFTVTAGTLPVALQNFTVE